MTSGHRILWNWDVSFGNILSVLLTVGAIVVAVVGVYVRYEKRFVQQEERIQHVEQIAHQNGKSIKYHAALGEVHASEADTAMLFVPRTLYSSQEIAQEQRIQMAQKGLKDDLAEIKEMVRDNGRAGREQYQSLTTRIDNIVAN